MTPTVNWGEWPIVAVLFVAAILFAGAVRWLLDWQASGAEKREAALMAWMDKRDTQWQDFLSEQSGGQLRAIADLSKNIDCNTTEISKVGAKVDVVLQAVVGDGGRSGQSGRSGGLR